MTEVEFYAFLKNKDVETALKLLGVIAGHEPKAEFGGTAAYSPEGFICIIEGPTRIIRLEAVSNEYNARGTDQIRN